MTTFSKSILAAAFAAPLALPAAAQTTPYELSAYEVMLLRAEIREDVTDAVIDYYNSTEVVEDTSPGDVEIEGLQSGQPIPETVEFQPVPEELLEMLPQVGDAEWRQVNNHLVAVDEGVANVVVWEVLP